eukprot:6212030-Pleurochrysis_carterae.AAC.3
METVDSCNRSTGTRLRARVRLFVAVLMRACVCVRVGVCVYLRALVYERGESFLSHLVRMERGMESSPPKVGWRFWRLCRAVVRRYLRTQAHAHVEARARREAQMRVRTQACAQMDT